MQFSTKLELLSLKYVIGLFPVAQTNCNISRILEKVYFLLPPVSGWWTLEGNEDLKQIGNLLRNFDDKSV